MTIDEINQRAKEQQREIARKRQESSNKIAQMKKWNAATSDLKKLNQNQRFEKQEAIEKSLQKMGWLTSSHGTNSDTGSNSFYIDIRKPIDDGSETGDDFINTIRFSDHDLPDKYRPSDYEVRYDLDSNAWNNLKPKLKKLYTDTVKGNQK